MKKMNKKMLLSIVTGALITVAIIGAGTFAWFTGSATAQLDGEFTTAFIHVVAENLTLNVYDFYPGDAPLHQTVERQRSLEGNFDLWWAGRNDTTLNLFSGLPYNVFRHRTFWSYMPPHFGGTNAQFPEVNIFNVDQLPVNFAGGAHGVNRVNVIRNPWDSRLVGGNIVVDSANERTNVTPSSIIEATFGFNINTPYAPHGGLVTTIPVYFRVPAILFESNITAPGVELAYIQTAVATISGGLNADQTDFRIRMPMAQVGEWFYSPVPLSALLGWQVDISYFVYISGAQNSNPALQNATFQFTNPRTDDIVVEIIQATNNAVFMVDGWREAAMLETIDSIVSPGPPGQSGVFFIPYVDAELYQRLLALWGF